MMFIDAELIAALIALVALAISGVYAFAKLGSRVDNLEREVGDLRQDVGDLRQDVKDLRHEVQEFRQMVMMALYGRIQPFPYPPGLTPPNAEAPDG